MTQSNTLPVIEMSKMNQFRGINMHLLSPLSENLCSVDYYFKCV